MCKRARDCSSVKTLSLNPGILKFFFFVFFFSSLPYPNLLTFTFMYSLHVVYKPCFKVSNFPSPPALFSSRLSFVSPDRPLLLCFSYFPSHFIALFFSQHGCFIFPPNVWSLSPFPSFRQSSSPSFLLFLPVFIPLSRALSSPLRFGLTVCISLLSETVAEVVQGSY